MSQIATSFDQDQRNFRETEKRRRAMLFEARQAQLRGMPVPQEFFSAVNEGAVYDPGVQEAQRTISAYNRASQGIPELSAQFPATRRSAEEMARRSLQRSSVSDGSAYSLPPMTDDQITAAQERLRQGEARFPIGTPSLIPTGDQRAAMTEEARRRRERVLGIQGAAQAGAERQLRGVPVEVEQEEVRQRGLVAAENQRRRAIESQARYGFMGDAATAVGGVAEAGITAGGNVSVAGIAANASQKVQESTERIEMARNETDRMRAENERALGMEQLALTKHISDLQNAIATEQNEIERERLRVELTIAFKQLQNNFQIASMQAANDQRRIESEERVGMRGVESTEALAGQELGEMQAQERRAIEAAAAATMAESTREPMSELSGLTSGRTLKERFFNSPLFGAGGLGVVLRPFLGRTVSPSAFAEAKSQIVNAVIAVPPDQRISAARTVLSQLAAQVSQVRRSDLDNSEKKARTRALESIIAEVKSVAGVV